MEKSSETSKALTRQMAYYSPLVEKVMSAFKLALIARCLPPAAA